MGGPLLASTVTYKPEGAAGGHRVVMHGESDRLGSAQARWNDYVGTAAADDADAILDTRSLYEIVGLDRDRWAIVGVDFSLADSSDHVVVYAEDRGSTSTGAPADDGHLPVTAFHLTPSRRLDEFLKRGVQAGLGQAAVRVREAPGARPEHTNLDGAASR
jgi:hypothetical protein